MPLTNLLLARNRTVKKEKEIVKKTTKETIYIASKILRTIGKGSFVPGINKTDSEIWTKQTPYPNKSPKTTPINEIKLPT